MKSPFARPGTIMPSAGLAAGAPVVSTVVPSAEIHPPARLAGCASRGGRKAFGTGESCVSAGARDAGTCSEVPVTTDIVGVLPVLLWLTLRPNTSIRVTPVRENKPATRGLNEPFGSAAVA